MVPLFESDIWRRLVDEVAGVWWGGADCPDEERAIVDTQLRIAVEIDRAYRG